MKSNEAFPKIFTIPGLRVGFVIASQTVIDTLRRFIPPWSVNSLALAAIEYLTTEPEAVEGFIQQTTEFVANESKLLVTRFENDKNIQFYPSTTVFLLARLAGGSTAKTVKDQLLKEKILIRDCSNFAGLSDRYIRISLKSAATNRRLAEALAGL